MSINLLHQFNPLPSPGTSPDPSSAAAGLLADRGVAVLGAAVSAASRSERTEHRGRPGAMPPGGECAGLSRQEAEAIEAYTCPLCAGRN